MKILVRDTLSIRQAPGLFITTLSIVNVHDGSLRIIHGGGSGLSMWGDMFVVTSSY